ncbi:MAG TPA: glycosyltransferase family 2 protein [Candidatus Omnitrophota bacterium]|jgi:glycosyltransferase involved in cell wall biosynthesis|nr:glycosyltransferase family 2 protein [Candidatus Omnitrophota bacterium]
MRVCAVIPARDAADTVAPVVRGLRATLPEATILVVDDGSSDETGARAREAGAEVIRHTLNQGKGAALQTGFDEAVRRGADAVIALDADGQHDPAWAPRLLAGLESADLVVGSRLQSREGMPWLRRVTNDVTSWWVSRLARTVIEDSQSGYRAIRAPVLRRVRPEARRFEYESEFLVAAARAGFRIAAVGIPTLYNAPGSHIRPVRDTVRFVRFVLRHLFR